jgi:hypothetical protein
MASLHYPHDRYNGFVQLTDGNGNAYVADFRQSYTSGCEIADAIEYNKAFLVLAHRMNNNQPCESL